MGNPGSGPASADLERGRGVQGFLGNVLHGRPGPAEASSNSRLASQQGHSPHHLPSPAKATEVLEAGPSVLGWGPQPELQLSHRLRGTLASVSLHMERNWDPKITG